ncbi:aminopeptidase P family protein [Actinobacteria bacterium YIM 96077]|uniref:Aminopeptidase P family protein n=1 Tax=Phytoactinopolyspora halophila TaxID=1981511 RepID=A0A329QZF1_9ACTN|nr:aminopeptidase P family protein [Actinobacteria bacterium YIM 96077]RAW17671.1 aminopeptidase P family protein [Phytoactinopolyspora halophila]
MDFGPAVFDDRLARTRAAARAAGIDALLVTPGSDLRYLTGYDALPLERLTCLVLPADGPTRLVVPALERPAALESPASQLDLEIRDWPETEDPVELVASMLPGARRVGLNDHMWAEKVLRFRSAMPDAEQVLAGEVLSELRMRKDAAEVDALREAGQAIDRVHARISEWLRPGRTEAEVGRDIAEAIVAEGHVRADFVIVASGPNGASPHHEAGERVIERGDAVVIDIGGTTAAGYCSDETRTYVIGEPPDGFAERYDVLVRAQEAAVEHVRPGVSTESVDTVARDVLTDAGLGEYFIHRIGHGIGMDTHEAPYLVDGNTSPMEPGMTFSIEPGFYIPGQYGARIEDIVAVTDTGVERLNTRPREMTVLHA